jgi:hypothetical protein
MTARPTDSGPARTRQAPRPTTPIVLIPRTRRTYQEVTMPAIVRTLALTGAATVALLAAAPTALAATDTPPPARVQVLAANPAALPDDHHAAYVVTAAGTTTVTPAVAPGVAPASATSVSVQLGAGAIAVGLVVWAIAWIKAGKWQKGPVLVGFAVGTVLAGANGLLGMPGEMTNSLISSLGQSLGQL